MQLLLDRYDSPLGELLLATDEKRSAVRARIRRSRACASTALRNHYGEYTLQAGPAPASITPLDDYFAGHLAARRRRRRHRRHAVPARRLESSPRDSARRHRQLRRNRRPHPPSHRHPSRRSRQRRQSHRAGRSLPPSHRRQPPTNRLRRRPAKETLAARA